MCPGCYKENIEGYCTTCRKKLFDGTKISSILTFDPPNEDNFPEYQQKTKRLSISGVQLKYSLHLDDNELKLTDQKGEYILKPIPPARQLVMQDQAPENEHLTMQIATQLFNIPVAENALIFFKNGDPAYITRRFDIKPDGTKYLQEDFAQIIGKTKNTHGDNYKYDGTYEDVGKSIREKVAAYPPVLEQYFKLVVFNYLFSNGDAHLKNFSLIESDHGDYILSKAYDLMSTVLHTPHEEDTALDLFTNDIQTNFYQTHGYYGRPNFEELAERLGMIPKRVQLIIDFLTSKSSEVVSMSQNSFLSEEPKAKYIAYYRDKAKRL